MMIKGNEHNPSNVQTPCIILKKLAACPVNYPQVIIDIIIELFCFLMEKLKRISEIVQFI